MGTVENTVLSGNHVYYLLIIQYIDNHLVRFFGYFTNAAHVMPAEGFELIDNFLPPGVTEYLVTGSNVLFCSDNPHSSQTYYSQLLRHAVLPYFQNMIPVIINRLQGTCQ